MSKITINNEIVLMRQAVRQSRVSVVRKLIKEAKLLQARKHGDEKIREKCKRKAQRLVAEIAAIKKIKDDEISKFGITETRKLQEILNDLKSEPNTRVMARLAFHKILQDKIVKFREKFPVYEEHLGPGRKKLSKLQRKANREARNALKQNTGADVEEHGEIADKIEKDEVDDELEESSSNEEDNFEDSEAVIEPVDSNIHEGARENKPDDFHEEGFSYNDDEKAGSIQQVKTSISTSKKRKNDDESTGIETKMEEISNDFIFEVSEKPMEKPEKPKKEKKKSACKILTELKKPRPIKVISKEASVKRFTDLIEDKESQEVVQEQGSSIKMRKSDVKIEKQADSFFMTENGESEYMSVIVPKSKLCEDEEQDDRFSQNHAAKRQQNFHEKNNKFFSKIDQRNDHRYGDNFGSNAVKQRSNNYSNVRGSVENHIRPGNGPARSGKNFKQEFEKKSEPKDEELHPSWAARKKQQEILKQGFQGKKIIFDD